jgi:hypothetical protein
MGNAEPEVLSSAVLTVVRLVAAKPSELQAKSVKAFNCAEVDFSSQHP